MHVRARGACTLRSRPDVYIRHRVGKRGRGSSISRVDAMWRKNGGKCVVRKTFATLVRPPMAEVWKKR